MSSSSSKPACFTCNKGIGQFKCEGCSQSFCTKHVAEHRQLLNQQLDEIGIEYDICVQVIENKNGNEPLLTSIDQWEKKSIDKIQETAKEFREKINQFGHTQTKIIPSELNHLKEQLKKAREKDDFFENDLSQWISTLEKLKQELKTYGLSRNIKEDLTAPLVYQPQFSSSSMEDVPNSVNKMHPRLQYINQDGIYVNPKSMFVTAIWYFYSPTHKRWYWTPYKKFEDWIPVDSVIVRSGYYKDQVPALINVEIIEYLRQNNPLPPDSIVQVASKAETRILRL